MSRAIWKGNITFGLVSVPVELHTAAREHRPRFRLLHAKDLSPVRYTRVCQQEERPVEWDELVKGYEYEKGRFVTLTKDDFEAAALEKTKTIDILDFVKAEEIDVRYFETPYYLLPSQGANRPYALLREAIRETGKIGIGKFILRESQHLVALMAIREALVLVMVRFADQLEDAGQMRFPDAKEVRPKELELAKSLVESLTDSWSPEKYADEYQENLKRVIQAKLKGKKPELVAEVSPRSASVVDLMERLRKSLETRKEKKAPGKKPAKKGKGRVA